MHSTALARHSKPSTNGKPSFIMSQKEMTLTQFAFIGWIVLFDKEFGFHHSKEELETLIHFWRSVGYLLGIEDKYNICSGSLSQVRSACQEVLDCYFRPHLERPSAQCKELSYHLLTGLHYMCPFVTSGGFSAFTYDLINVPFSMSNITRYELLLFKLQKLVMGTGLNHCLVRFWLRPLLNFLLWLAFTLSTILSTDGNIPNLNNLWKKLTIAQTYTMLELNSMSSYQLVHLYK